MGEGNRKALVAVWSARVVEGCKVREVDDVEKRELEKMMLSGGTDPQAKKLGFPSFQNL